MTATRPATTQNDTLSDDTDAIPPITPGATRPLPYAMPATPAMLRAGCGPTRPAAAKTSGAAGAADGPSSAEPTRPGYRPGATTTAIAPPVAHTPENPTVRPGPSRRITRSP